MTFISYAQNNEDVLLWRALGDVEDGFYIDVGASDPVEHSVTRAFYDAGWRGINIEPLPVHIEAFERQRPRDINLAVAAGAADGTLTLYDVPAVRGWASPQQDVAAAHRAEGHQVTALDVPVRTLAAVCAEHVKGEIHFLKIDVEGFEEEVLRGMDLRRWRPWVLVIEATLPNSRVTSHDRWEHLVTGQDYHYAWFDGLNRYYVADEHAHLLARLNVQPNVFDDYVPYHLDEAWMRLRAAEEERHAQDEERRVQEEERRALEDELRASEQDLATLRAALAVARSDLDRSTAHLADLQKILAASGAWAKDLERRLLALEASLAWRLTLPLRAAGGLAKALRRPHLARRVVTRLTANEGLRRLLIPVLLRYPALGRRVTQSISAIKLAVPLQTPDGAAVPDHLKDLPLSVRAVLLDLERARSKGRANCGEAQP
jgi:FkbM family methyltransferase